MKIVIASDSFKGCLSSAEVADAVSEGLKHQISNAEICTFAVADGGEGTTSAIVEALSGHWHGCKVLNTLMQEISVQYGVVSQEQNKVAVIEMASASGLILLKPSERDVMNATSYGTGMMIIDAYDAGCRSFIIGIGGSATCDGGIGMLSALGVKFYDKYGKPLTPNGKSLNHIFKIDLSCARNDILNCRYTIICDVTNPLYGPEGAAFIFAPQKGADAAQIVELDEGLQNYSEIIKDTIGIDVSTIPGAGAAGGLGAAFMAFFNSVIKTGIEAVLDIVGIDKALAGADLVITGEGKMDTQTLYGKTPIGVCMRAKRHGVPVIAIAGMVQNKEELLAAGFDRIYTIDEKASSIEESMNPEIAKKNLFDVGSQIIKDMR